MATTIRKPEVKIISLSELFPNLKMFSEAAVIPPQKTPKGFFEALIAFFKTVYRWFTR